MHTEKPVREVKFTDTITSESTIEDLKLILDQAEKRNNGFNENANSLYQKAVTFLSVSIAALTSIVIYLSDKKPSFSPQYLACWELTIILAIVCTKLKPIMEMDEFYGAGANRLI